MVVEQHSSAARPEAPASKWKLAVRALRHRNYQIFFGGQSISLIGSWMTRIATGWLVYRLTDSAFLLGVVAFAGQLPFVFLGPFAGVWVDRWDRHRVLVVAQALSMAQSLALAALALSGRITIWQIIVLSVLQGAVNAFEMPARQAFVIQMVEDRADLPNAIALNSSMFNGSRLLGPALAGIVIAAWGEGYCFLIDGLSYIAVILSLWAMKLPPRRQEGQRRNLFAELKEGWGYAWRFVPIRAILLLLALVSVVAMPYTLLLPVFAGSILQGGPYTLGFLTAASGAGALAGALALAVRKSVRGLGRVIPLTAALFGAALIVFGLSRVLWLSLLLMALIGYGMMQQMAASNTVLQTIVDEDKRGRVMSFYMLAFMGTAPAGSLLAGTLAERVGAPLTLVLGGTLCLAAAAWFTTQLEDIRRLVRPIYVERGIIGEVAAGLQAATTLQAPPAE